MDRRCVGSSAIAAAAFALAAAAGPAKAGLVQFSFAGTVTSNNPLAGTPAIGSGIAGSYIIDPGVVAGEGPNCVATPNCWSGSDTSWNWNGAAISLAGTFPAAAYGIFTSVVDHAPNTGPDILTVNLGGDNLAAVTLTLTDPTGSEFETSNTSLFTSKVFSFVPLCVTGIGCAFNPAYSGVLTSFVSSPVPEPSGLPMGLLGGLAVVALRRRSAAAAAA